MCSSLTARLSRLEQAAVQEKKALQEEGTRPIRNLSPWTESVRRIDCGQGSIIDRKDGETLEHFHARVLGLTMWSADHMRKILSDMHMYDEDWTEEDTEEVINKIIADRREIGLPVEGIFNA